MNEHELSRLRYEYLTSQTPLSDLIMNAGYFPFNSESLDCLDHQSFQHMNQEKTCTQMG